MATIQFYQKPGCATNARQKRMLEAAGHTVIARSLLTEPWTAERLRGFFGSRRSRRGSIPPLPASSPARSILRRLDAASALALMLDDPLLIRRPLVEADGQRCAGFDREPVTSLLGDRPDEDAEKCSRPAASTALSGSSSVTEIPAAMNVVATQVLSPAEIVLAYHARTKHTLKRYAAGPETLDWDTQPNPFREFAGCARTELELGADRLATSFAEARTPGGVSPVALTSNRSANCWSFPWGSPPGRNMGRTAGRCAAIHPAAIFIRRKPTFSRATCPASLTGCTII